jgi:hypothetical protein
MILEIHGGPHTAYGPQFSGEVQLYAAAGYVVLYTNPRGSTSYGETFANEIDKAYPGQDVDDLLSGVDALIARGFVDEDRLFVTGGSGGGVLTAQLIGVTDRFAAAAVGKPVINWTSFTLAADIGPSIYRYWFGVTPWDAPEEYWRRSPLSLVGNVETPASSLWAAKTAARRCLNPNNITMPCRSAGSTAAWCGFPAPITALRTAGLRACCKKPGMSSPGSSNTIRRTLKTDDGSQVRSGGARRLRNRGHL